MAQLERNSESFKHAKSPHSIAFDQLIQGEERCWSPNTSPTQKCINNNDQEEAFPNNNNNNQHNKKSVLTKVKERAKKLRHSLSGGKKKHENHVPGETNSTRPAWVYESELAPEDYKETARQHPRADPLFSEKSVFPLQAATKPGNEKEAGEERSNATEPQPSSSSIDSKFSGLTVAATAAKTEEKDKEGISSPTRWDKGVSVKEYLMNKLEPGEDERELSKVISEAMSPRTRAPGDRGVVEKVKDAVSSFLRPQPPPINQFLSRVAAATNHTEVSPSQGSVSATNGNSSPLIPVSTNAHEELTALFGFTILLGRDELRALKNRCSRNKRMIPRTLAAKAVRETQERCKPRERCGGTKAGQANEGLYGKLRVGMTLNVMLMRVSIRKQRWCGWDGGAGCAWRFLARGTPQAWSTSVCTDGQTAEASGLQEALIWLKLFFMRRELVVKIDSEINGTSY
ncbi:hypothetical protein DM860_012172 [Cuscuta australis]|uniref:LTI65/LTI78 PGEED repeat domain-containing protein n=1 Tax=Cuscuta australis TaxID=267555 RepID=A0A328DDW8_9ASTE|nr:hypothetical protein DM860_012172 [Cuscuta australis]